MVLADRREEVVGIGLDYNEAPFPPAPFKEMYDKARAAGLHVTAHAGESGPAPNVRDSIDILHVDRIDHGYHVVDDPALVARCRERGTFFTCCPSTSGITSPWKDLSAPDHAIRQMVKAGLNVMINSDDPPMFNTDLANEYVRCATEMRLTPAELKAMRAEWHSRFLAGRGDEARLAGGVVEGDRCARALRSTPSQTTAQCRKYGVSNGGVQT